MGAPAVSHAVSAALRGALPLKVPQKIGEEAFDALLAALRGDCSINKVLEHRIIEGETV
jgi:hypothetical protein